MLASIRCRRGDPSPSASVRAQWETDIKLGVVFPQTEIGTDPEAVAGFATAAEDIGYDHVIVYDHVLGANPGSRPGWYGPYTSKSQFLEPFVLYGYLAGLTQTLELVTAVLILPQRQTALVAKQAACADVLSRGRLRLGIGTGWNDVEYEALGEDFHNRGARSEEQIDRQALGDRGDRLRWQVAQGQRCWPQSVADAAIHPRLAGRHGAASARSVARLADGWFPFYNDALETQIETVRAAARAAGRNPDDIGVECMQPMGDCGAAERDRLKSLRDMGVTHTAVITMNHGLPEPAAHVEAIKRYWDSVASKV